MLPLAMSNHQPLTTRDPAATCDFTMLYDIRCSSCTSTFSWESWSYGSRDGSSGPSCSRRNTEVFAWYSHLSRFGALSPGVRASMAFIAPHPECPHTTMLATFSASTAYSMALASDRSPVEEPSGIAGGI